MRYQIITAAVLGLCALYFIFGGDSPSEEALSTADSTEQLNERVADLEAEVNSLRAEAKSSASTAKSSNLMSAAEEADSMLARKVAAVAQAQGLVDENGETSPEVREQLGKIIREEMATARNEAIERRMQRRAERQEMMVEEFVASHGLDEEQASRMTEIMLKEQDQISQLFLQAREDGTWHEARNEAMELRTESDQALTELLDDEQMSAWQEARDESRSHRGGPRGRGGNR